MQLPAIAVGLEENTDRPLKVARDKFAKKEYLLCEFNRGKDSDSYRYGIHFSSS
jgi:hypothetical protein